MGPEECPLQLFYAWLYGTGFFFMVFNFISFLINIGRKFWGIPHLEKDEITTKEVMFYLCSRGLLLAFRILIMMFNLAFGSLLFYGIWSLYSLCLSSKLIVFFTVVIIMEWIVLVINIIYLYLLILFCCPP